MAAKKTAKKTTKKKATKKRRGVKIKPTELAANELALPADTESVRELSEQVATDGGTVLATYKEPLGGNTLLFAALPIDKVEPTPFQRDVSDAHVRKLTVAMDKTKRFLDPVIVVRHEDKYLTPNGNHRLTVMKELGAKAILALIVPERRVAYQILALNIEKAHNLRERALEVVRMYRDLAEWADAVETDYELEFEEPSLVTLGFCYEKNGRFAGSAYAPVVKRIDEWLPGKLAEVAEERERRAGLLLAMDKEVNAAVKRLKEAGFNSPYIKAFVVARANPIRFNKGELPPFDEVIAKMAEKASNLKTDKIKPEDLARSGGAPSE